ncbi:hypothetical protein [Nonomuraea endophytica]|uniref:Secreted protein n=1 Tax=Nonomuraea endophytica TaxID=714136 RepID=A0A7W8A4P2_9ACTN|nr:hypothetical protein [Nonomuraea endophytica]MBB5079517.1 hypothetical protein [Nonomuraea endophytica]
MRLATLIAGSALAASTLLASAAMPALATTATSTSTTSVTDPGPAPQIDADGYWEFVGYFNAGDVCRWVKNELEEDGVRVWPPGSCHYTGPHGYWFEQWVW